MRIAKLPEQLDLVCDPSDDVEIILEAIGGNPRLANLYVHVNGVTVLRVGRIDTIVRGELKVHNKIEDTSL